MANNKVSIMIFWFLCFHQIFAITVFLIYFSSSRCQLVILFGYVFHDISMKKNLKLTECMKFHLSSQYFFVYFGLFVVYWMTLIRFEKLQRMHFHLQFWKKEPFIPLKLQKYRRNRPFRKVFAVYNDLKIFLFTCCFQLFALFEKF